MIKVLFMGTPEFAAVSLEHVYNAGFPVVGIFTQPDKRVGRKQQIEYPPVKILGEKLGIPVFQPQKLRDGTALDILETLKPDVIAVVAYGRILPREILDYPRLGCINIHGSLLPKYRGAAPIQWAIINGEKTTGVTAMYMSEELDAGDIIDIRKIDILPGETSGELFERLAPIGGDLLCSTLQSIESGTAKRYPQDNLVATYAPQLTKADSPISWDMPGDAIISKISGLDPWPIATASIGGAVVKVFKAFFTEKSTSAPGIITSSDKGIEVSCLDGVITITELQAPGGKRMKATDYLRGHPLCP